MRPRHLYLLMSLVELMLLTGAAQAQKPVISSFTPSNGVAGSTVTITGSNFRVPASTNIVYFGGVRANVMSVNGQRTQMTVAVPSGATFEPITVTTNNLTGNSRLPFRLTSPSIATVNFAPKRVVGSGRTVVAADFNGDAKPDLISSVVDISRLDYLGSYRNTSPTDSITFAAVGRAQLGVARGPFSIARGDFDGDGLIDAAVTSNDSGSKYVSVFRNTSTVSAVQFNRVIELATAGTSSDVAISDLNDDGKPDLIVTTLDSNVVQIFPNTSSGTGSITFGVQTRLAGQGGVLGVAAGDLNGDGLDDVVVSEQSFGRVAVFRKNGSGDFNFFAKVTFDVGSVAQKIRLTDFDNDGRLDIAVSLSGAQRRVALRLNTTTVQSNITFNAAQTFLAGGLAIANLAVGDLNLDGKPDIAVPNYDVDSVTVLVNSSSGAGNIGFNSPIAFSVGRGPQSVSIADFNDDGRPDIAVAGNGTDYRISEVSVLRSSLRVPFYSVNRSTLSFSAPINNTRTDSVIVTNTGTDTLRVVSATLSNAKFQVSPTNAIILPGNNRGFRVTFTPLQDTTLQRDTLRIIHNATGSPSLIALSGVGIASRIAVDRSQLAIATPINTSRTDSILISNIGTDSLRITSASLSNSRFQASAFGSALAPGATRSLRITFNPLQDTTFQRDTLRINHNGLGSPRLVPLSGVGIASRISLDRTQLAFIAPINTSRTDSILVSNIGTDSLRITSLSLSNARFQTSAFGAPLAPAATRLLRVSFNPQQDTTLQRDTLRINHNGLSSPRLVPLSGRGIVATFSLNRTSLSFVAPLNTPRTDSVTVTNQGTDTLRILTAVGANARFQVTPSNAVLLPSGARVFRMTFNPQQDTTLQRDTVRFTHSAAGSPSVVLLSGQGVAPRVSLNRTALTFTTLVNTSQSDSVAVTNSGTDTLRIAGALLSNARFQVLPPNAIMLPGTVRYFRITFSPQQDTTLQRDTLRLNHNAIGSPTLVVLSGRGVLPPAPAFLVNRTQLSISTVVNTSRSDSVLVSNNGNDSLRISAAQVATTRFQVAPTNAVVAPSNSRFFRIAFTPGQDTTLQRDSLRFIHNAVGSPHVVALTGRGIPPSVPFFSANRVSVAFVSRTNVPRRDTVSVTNTGSDTLRISSATLSTSRFQVQPSSAIVAPNVSRAFVVTFTPQDTSLQRDTLRFVHNAVGSPSVIPLAGRGLQAFFSANRTSLSFVVQTNRSQTDSVVVSNTGNDTLSVAVSFGNSRFQVTPFDATILPGLTMTFRVTFEPQQDTTLQRDTLRFSHSANGSPYVVPLSGRGFVPAAPLFTLSRSSLAIETLVNTSRQDSVFVTNTGNDTLNVFSVLTRNPSFSVAPSSARIEPSRAQTFRVSFSPGQDTLLKRDTLTFVHNAVGSPHLLYVSGRGIPPSLPIATLNRTSLTFNVQVNSSLTDSVVITNTGADTLRIFLASLTNPKFQVSPSNASLPPGNARTFRVTFAPQQDTTLQRDTLKFATNAAGSPHVVALSGRGIPLSVPFFQSDSSSLTFGRVVVNTTRDLTFTISNPGSSVLRVDSVRSSNAAFRFLSPDTATIAPATNRQFVVRFAPTIVGERIATLRVYHNAGSRSDTVALRGSSQLPAPTNLRVVDSTSAAGQLRVQWSQIVPQRGFVRYRLYGAIFSNPTAVIDSTQQFRIDSTAKTVTNLLLGRRYYFRVAAVDSLGVESPLSNQTSAHVGVRPPQAATVGSSLDTLTLRAMLRGRVNPNGDATTAWFQYDSLRIFTAGSRTTAPRSLGNGSAFLVLEDSTEVLERDRKYFFRTLARNSFDSLTVGALDSFVVPRRAVSVAVAPEQQFPPNNINGIGVATSLSWARSVGATRYHLQIALDSLFNSTTFYVLNDSTIVDSMKTVARLAAATTYYWRVGAAFSFAQSTLFSSFRVFQTEQARSVQSPTIVFPSNPTSDNSYRLVGVPGRGATLADLISGAGPQEGIDWRFFSDNGNADTNARQHLAAHNDPSFPLAQGEGYWLIRKNSLTLSRSVTMSSLSNDGTVSIPLHNGYNIIANPFELPLSWSYVRAKNASIPNARISSYIGSGYDSISATQLEPFKGYYFFKEASAPATLKIPYPFSTANESPTAPAITWQVQLEYRTGATVDKLNFIGIAPAAAQSRDSLENRKPPMIFNRSYLYFDRPEWDPDYRQFSDDFRPALNDGQVWDFEIANPERTKGVVNVIGIEQIPQAYEIVLVNLANTMPFDVRRSSTYEFTPTNVKSKFKFIVGTKEFVANEAQKLVPERFALLQNYPNPFNPSTSISFAIARPSRVRLDVFSLLGQTVKTLVNDERSAAFYTVNWNGDDNVGGSVASGVYFYRLLIDGKPIETRKMMYIR